MFDVPVMVWKLDSSASRNFVVSASSLACCTTPTDIFCSSYPLCRFLAGIIISCPAHLISVPSCVRKFHPNTNESTTPGSINWLMPKSISISSCSSSRPHLPSANLTCRRILVIFPRAARMSASSLLINLAVAPVSIVAVYVPLPRSAFPLLWRCGILRPPLATLRLRSLGISRLLAAFDAPDAYSPAHPAEQQALVSTFPRPVSMTAALSAGLLGVCVVLRGLCVVLGGLHRVFVGCICCCCGGVHWSPRGAPVACCRGTRFGGDHWSFPHVSWVAVSSHLLHVTCVGDADLVFEYLFLSANIISVSRSDTLDALRKILRLGVQFSLMILRVSFAE